MVNEWTRDDLPGVHWPDIHGESERLGAEKALDAVVAHLNTHHPKPEPYDQGGVRGADSLLYRAERERDEAWHERDRNAERSAQLLAERDAAVARAEQAEARVRLANQQSVEWEGEAERLLCERDEWKARAEAAERELADEYSEANQKAAAWDRIRAHPALRRNLLPDVEGSYADLVFERITWLAEVAETVTELQSAPAVSRAEIEQARFLRNQAMTHGWSSTASIQHAMMALVDQLLGERTKMTIPLPTIPNDPSADTPGELVEDVLEILEIMSPGSKMHTRDEVDSAIRVVLHQRSKKQKEPK